jgi:hypothetical protein
MRNLNATELLNIWEQGLNRSILHKALILLIAAFPELGSDAIAELSIGSRDACLLSLRERLFGSHLVNNAICPKCAGRIEWEQNISDFLVDRPEHSFENQFSLETDDYRLCFRLPNSIDMAELESCDAEGAIQMLLRRCVLSAEYAGAYCEIEQLPEYVIQSLSQRIEELDPQAEVLINLTCPECSHRWEVLFDIASFLWAEINDWSERMLQTVHKLAKAYGWTEQEILNLSPVRRQLYLGMAGS